MQRPNFETCLDNLALKEQPNLDIQLSIYSILNTPEDDKLTLSQMTNFRLFQTKRVCRQQS